MTVKTAISVEERLFKKIENLSRELHISRSNLFTLAAQEFIKRHENKSLLDAINKAYSDEPDTQERLLQKEIRARHRKLNP